MVIAADLCGASTPFIVGVLQALAQHNALWYRENPDAPSVEAAGVRYRPDPERDGVLVLDASRVLQSRVASCGSLAAAMYGYFVGAPAAAAKASVVELVVERVTASTWHAFVRIGGQVWDPARRLRRG